MQRSAAMVSTRKFIRTRARLFVRTRMQVTEAYGVVGEDVLLPCDNATTLLRCQFCGQR